MFIFIISFLACATSTVSLIPQVYKTYKSKSVDDLSTIMLWNFCLCSLLWIVYGLATDSITVWVTNVIMLIFSVMLVYFKIKYGGKVSEEDRGI